MNTPLSGTIETAGWDFDYSYLTLASAMHSRVDPVTVSSPQLAMLNESLAKELGLKLDAIGDNSLAAMFCGNLLPKQAQPFAQAYAGHQYGHFTLLGDGRAIVLGEHLKPDGSRVDIQLKGSGMTPYSRRGDGRAALGPMMRELIISEAMHALGIPTTRSLAVTRTGESVLRERPLPGAVLTRVAASHIRVGTFEFAAAIGDPELLRSLADYTIQRLYPELTVCENPYLALLQTVIDRQAALISKWMLVGFIHGVMNTDNMAISGETIDYGPCAFMDTYGPDTVFSSIDEHGRYAYGQQPRIAQWNLARFAETLIPLLAEDPEIALSIAEDAIRTFPNIYQLHWKRGMCDKLGLITQEESDADLIRDLLVAMQASEADFTSTFRQLGENGHDATLWTEDTAMHEWLQRWRTRIKSQPGGLEQAQTLMNRNNPAVIPRNHLVEAALDTAVDQNDFKKAETLIELLRHPFDLPPHLAEYARPPLQRNPGYRTFCGT